MGTSSENYGDQVVLDWTGHPLVDVGIATICAMTNKDDPRDLTLTDLDEAAAEMAEYYYSSFFRSYLYYAFTLNSYHNPSPNISHKTKQEYKNRVLFAHRYHGDDGAQNYRCSFSDNQATHLIHRGQMPMITGSGILNFFPAGLGALPIFGPYLVALQALPLGGRKSERGVFIAHSDYAQLTIALAKTYLNDNRRIISLYKSNQLPQHKGPSSVLERGVADWDANDKVAKYPKIEAGETLLSIDLMELWRDREKPFFIEQPISITAYWINNGKNPSLKLFHLPSQIVRFLSLVNSAPLYHHWQAMVAQGWNSNGQSSGAAAAPGLSRNNVLADLFAVYDSGFLNTKAAKAFIRRHLLRASPQRTLTVNKDDYQGHLNNPELICWPLTELFVEEVIGMDPRYIQSVKNFADTLASHIEQTNDKNLFRQVVYSRYPWQLRNSLTKAQRNQAKTRNELLFGLQEYLEVFEAEDIVGKSDWSLARDLISIRLVEQLHQKQWFEKDENKELLDEPDSKEVS